jgi:cell division protein FtsN
MEKNAAANSRTRRPGGLVLNTVQVGLVTGFIAVALLVVFGLGVIIGMWYQAGGRTPASADMASAAIEDRVTSGPATDKHEPEVTFYSTLTTNDSSPASWLPVPSVSGPSQQASVNTPSPPAPAPARPAPSQPTVDGSPSPAQSPTRTAAVHDTTAQAVQAAAPPPTRTAAVPPSRPQGPLYSVQVGSFRTAEQAETLRQRLAQKGYDVRVRLSMVPGRGAWYRVRVGRFSNRAAAEEMARRLSSQERRSVLVAEESP